MQKYTKIKVGNRNIKDYTNTKFTRLLVIRVNKEKTEATNNETFWDCICDCGETITTTGNSLSMKTTTSCGCIKKEKLLKWIEEFGSSKNPGNKTHGKCKSPEYTAWRGMLKRCHSEDDSCYKNYGNRGIIVCPEWRASFAKFYEYIGDKPKPKDKYSIDRINSSGNYEPGNVRWATREQQNRNTNRNVLNEKLVREIRHLGENLTIQEISIKLNININTIGGVIYGYTWKDIK